MALFRRKTTLQEALEAVRAVLATLTPGEPAPPELAEIARSITARTGGFAAEPGSAQELIDGIPAGAGLLDARGRLAVVNEALDALFGQGRCLGRTLLEITRSGELGEASARALAGKPVQGDFEVAALQKLLSVSLAPLAGPRALVVFRDLTEAKRLEGVRRDFIGNASHELRTPVAAIAGAAETLLAHGQPLDATARGFVEMIVRHADRLSRLTRDLLDLSRMETGEFRVELGPLELSPVCASAIELVRPRAEAKRITLGFDGPSQLRAVADRRALDQILVNLLDNAIKYTPEGGRVTLLADGAGGTVVLSVIDNGPGIEPRHQQRIFERFYRADPGRARESGGTGLGLAIVKHLAQAQRGYVGVESGNGGSRFWVKLPSA